MTSVPILFLDASVWIAAAGSSRGGSSMILRWNKADLVRLKTSRLVLQEAERNIRKKLGLTPLLLFYRTIADLDLELVDPPTPHEIEAQCTVIDRKDAHVLAAAIKARVSVLLTLDRKDFMTTRVLNAGLSFRIMTPGDFIQEQMDWPTQR